MKYIKKFKIFESVSQAKSILKSVNKDINDDSYLKIREILKGHDGYVGWFTNLHYKIGYNLNDLYELWNLIKLNNSYISKLPKALIKYDNIEKIQDDLEIIKGESSYNRILGEFPNKQRSFIKDSDRELLENLAKRKDNKSFFKKVASYHKRKEMIDAIKSFLSVDPNSNLDKVMKMAEKNGSDIIYYSYEDDILIIRVYNSSQLNNVAADCSWCIRNENTFKSYVNNESKQFIVFLFNRIDNLSRIGITARMTSKNFYHTAHNKIDARVDYDKLKEILSDYDVDPNDFMKFQLSDINIDDTSVARLIDTFNLNKNEIIKIKNKFNSDDISKFTKDEIENWNLLDKAELNYNTLIKYDWNEVVSKKLIQRLDSLTISNIVYMYKRYGYDVIDYLKTNQEILNSLNGTSFRSKNNDFEFYKEYILGGKKPTTAYGLSVGSKWSDNDYYSYERTMFRMLWFKDDVIEMLRKDNNIIVDILDIEGGDSKVLIEFLKDLNIDFKVIEDRLKNKSFKFELWRALVDLYKDRKIDYSDIVEYLYNRIMQYGIEDYELSKYKESGLFTDSQIKDFENHKDFIEFYKDIPNNPYSRNMTKSYSNEFYNKWKDKIHEYLKNPMVNNELTTIILVFAKLDKLSELEVYKYKFSSGSRTIEVLNEIISGTYITNSGLTEDLTDDEKKKIYNFLTKKCDLSDLNLKRYQTKEGVVEARDGEIESHYIESLYLYDKNGFYNYLMYDVSNLKYNYKNDDVFVPVPGDKNKNVTNRIYPIREVFNLFFRGKNKQDLSDLLDILTDIISFDLSLYETTYLIDIIEYYFTNYKFDDKNIKDLLLNALKSKTRSERTLNKYSKFLTGVDNRTIVYRKK